MILCGRVIKKEVREVESKQWRVKTVLVQASWKGDVPDTLLVWSSDQASMCGVDLQTDVDLLLFTHDQGEQHTGRCSPNSPMIIAFYERYRLGEPRKVHAAFNYKVVELNDLFEIATARDERVRLRAAASLAALNNERDVVVPRLITMLKGTSTSGFQSAVFALATMRDAPPEAGKALNDALQLKSESRRLEAYTTLQSSLGKCEYFPYALKGIADESDRIRSTVAKGLNGMGECLSDDQKKSLKKALEKSMNDSGATAKCYLIKALEECGCIAADWIPKLEKLKTQPTDKDNWVGYCAGQTAEKLKKACQ